MVTDVGMKRDVNVMRGASSEYVACRLSMM